MKKLILQAAQRHIPTKRTSPSLPNKQKLPSTIHQRTKVDDSHKYPASRVPRDSYSILVLFSSGVHVHCEHGHAVIQVVLHASLKRVRNATHMLIHARTLERARFARMLLHAQPGDRRVGHGHYPLPNGVRDPSVLELLRQPQQAFDPYHPRKAVFPGFAEQTFRGAGGRRGTTN